MEIKINTALTDLDDRPIPRRNSKEPETLKTVAMYALTGVDERELHESAEDKLNRFELAMTLKNCKDETLSITTDEAVMIKTRVNRFYGALVYGQVHKLIEGVKSNAPEAHPHGQGT